MCVAELQVTAPVRHHLAPRTDRPSVGLHMPALWGSAAVFLLALGQAQAELLVPCARWSIGQPKTTAYASKFKPDPARNSNYCNKSTRHSRQIEPHVLHAQFLHRACEQAALCSEMTRSVLIPVACSDPRKARSESGIHNGTGSAHSGSGVHSGCTHEGL